MFHAHVQPPAPHVRHGFLSKPGRPSWFHCKDAKKDANALRSFRALRSFLSDRWFEPMQARKYFPAHLQPRYDYLLSIPTIRYAFAARQKPGRVLIKYRFRPFWAARIR